MSLKSPSVTLEEVCHLETMKKNEELSLINLGEELEGLTLGVERIESLGKDRTSKMSYLDRFYKYIYYGVINMLGTVICL